MKRIIFLSLLILPVFFSCRQNRETPDTPASKAIPSVQISISPVVRQDMMDTIHIYGKVTLRQEAFLASQFDGRLTGFSLLIGDRVKKGEKLGAIVPPMREALLQIMNQIDESQRANLAQQIREIPLYSPINGVVLKVYQHSGDVVQKGETIVHIGQLNALDILADLPLKWLNKVRTLRKLQVTFINYSHPDLILPVMAIGGEVDQNKQTVPLRLYLDNSHRDFKPGMMVQLCFPGENHRKTLVIPRTALLEEEGIFSVFVLIDHNRVEKRLVKPGIFQDDKVEILSGVSEGEKVATKKAYSLTDGMEVSVK
ncbi:MAG: efflux RND transporter periplasmic adaptor subunit [Chlorobi bacterium]|nr:efflux RND transporter periplasmic adaptor subunit [Chlorobiota bacterium]